MVQVQNDIKNVSPRYYYEELKCISEPENKIKCMFFLR